MRKKSIPFHQRWVWLLLHQAKCRCTSLFVATSWRWPFLWCCSTSYQNWSPLHCSNGGSTVPSSQSPVAQTSTSSWDMHPSKHNLKPEVWHVHCLPKLSGLNYWTGLLDSSPHARSTATVGVSSHTIYNLEWPALD